MNYFNKTQNEIDTYIEDYLTEKVGPHEHSKKYYDSVLHNLSQDFQAGQLSSDDVSAISEWLFIKINDDFKKFQEFPNEFMTLMELNWYLRNDPKKAIETLEILKKFSA